MHAWTIERTLILIMDLIFLKLLILSLCEFIKRKKISFSNNLSTRINTANLMTEEIKTKSLLVMLVITVSLATSINKKGK
jgi:hypothetical protein